MGVVRTVMLVMVWCLCLLNKSYGQTATRIPISSISSNIATGQDYTPWLNDDVTSLVANAWGAANMQYVDVKLLLGTPANVSKLSLYDYESTFEAYPVTIYAAHGGTRTLLGTFLGLTYMNWVDINVASPVLADTIIVHKYGNCIPQKVQVYGVPVSTTSTGGMTIAGAGTVCRGASTPYTCAVTGGTWSSSNTTKATVSSASGIVCGIAAGTATITYKRTGVITTKIVTINPSPAAAVITGAAAVTTGGTITLADATPGGVWSSATPTKATVNAAGVVTGVAAGSATIKYAFTNMCGTATASKVITVSGTAAPTISGTATVCAGATTALTASVAGGVWSSSSAGVATVSSTGTVTGASAGTATISYTAGTSVATKVVTVSAAPTVAAIAGTATVTAGSTTALTDATAGGAWSSPATAIATVSTTGVVTGVAAGTATITYKVTTSCGVATATKVVTVSAATASTISGTSTVCIGSTTALTATLGGGAWSSSATGIATVSSSGSVTGVSAGTATISYTLGASVATMVVTVIAAPSAGTITGTTAVNTGATTTLSNTTTGGVWNSSATAVATISSAGVVTGVSAGTATINYTVTTSCGSATATATVTVSTPSAGTISGTATVCAGATTAFAASVAGGSWSSSATGVATVSASGVVTGVSAGTATISYVVSGATATRVVTVNALPSAGTISGTATVAAGATTVLSSPVTGGTWSSSATGVATVSAAGSVTGVAAGTATISYTVANSCGTAVATKVVTVSATSGGGTTGGGGGTGVWVTGKIPIEAKRWYQLNNCANGLDGLFDGNLTTAVNTGWGKILANYDAYYPVQAGERMNITSIKFYDGPGSNETAPFQLYYIDSNWNRVLIGTYIGTQYNMWVGPNAATPANYNLSIPANNVRYLVINCSGTYPVEMELYGTYMAAAPATTPTPRPIQLKQELGVNAFEWDFLNPSSPLVIDNARMNAIRSFGCVRHYLDWEKLEPTSGGYTFNPSHSGGWNLDTIYAKAKAEGIEMLVDIKTQPGWMQSTYPSGADAENVPVTYGSDFSNPNSYLKQAKVGFQFAARYGYNTSVSSSLLTVNSAPRWGGDPANAVRKGLGYVKYIECDNERDKWWKGRNAYQTGREYAANLSAFYDGNKNTMGAGVGVKNADPNMQVVMGGVAMPTVDYLMGMIDWCKEFRGYKADGSVNLCWDVINYHIYPDNANSMQGGGTRGAAPEVAHADTFAKRFVDVARKYAQNIPVWVTETGYDLNAGSPVKAIAIGSKTAKQTQGDWMLRNSLLYARMGVERTFFYMLDDVDTNSTTQFSSCGLVYGNYSRKPAADYIAQTKRLMGEYEYKETISANPIVDRYELAGQSAYVVVKPTENGTTMSYTLPLPMSAGTAKIYRPTVGQDSMAMATSPISGSSVALTVTETPMFIIPYAGAGRPAAATDSTAAFNDVIIKQPDVTVYPNPTTGVVNFVIDNATQGDMAVTIYTEGGQVAKTLTMSKPAGKYTNTVDLSYLPNGLYIVEIGRGKDRVTKKVIKVN